MPRRACDGELVLEILSTEIPMWECCIQKSRLTPLGMKTKDIPDSTSVMVCAALPDGCQLFKAEKDVVSGDVVACAIYVCVQCSGLDILSSPGKLVRRSWGPRG